MLLAPAPASAASSDVRGALALISRAGDKPSPRYAHAPAVAPLRDALPAARRALRIGGVACETTGPAWHCVAPGEALPDGPFDLIVVGHDVIAQVPCADALLQSLQTRLSPSASLVVDLAAPAPLELLYRCLDGDLTDDDDGPFAWPLRHATPPSLYKLLLDAGWMPEAVHTASLPFPTGATGQALLALAAARGLPPASAVRRLALGRMIVRARRLFDDAPQATPHEAAAGRFAVVVPTSRESQFSVDIERSPGLAEVGARIVSIRGAATPAQALERSCELLDEEWILLCHQDVYLPRGFGHRLQRLLASIPANEREATLIGFAGIGADAAGKTFVRAGFVIDRWSCFNHPENPYATSIDELALVVARRSLHRIDPSLGWHLWATDMCLSAIARHRCFARIVRLPLLHNSYADCRVPEDFYPSARRLAAKHAAAFGPIPTLCGTIGRSGDVTVEPAA